MVTLGGGFDDPGMFFADNFGFDQIISDNPGESIEKLDKIDLKRRCIAFISSFQSDNIFIYRDALKRNYARKLYTLKLNLDDVLGFDKYLFDKLVQNPNDLLELLEDSCRDIIYDMLKSIEENNEDCPKTKIEHIQVTFNWKTDPCKIKNLTSDKIATLVKVSGIVVAASSIRCKADKITIQCRNCKTIINNIYVNPGLEGFPLPRKCSSDQSGQVKCPLDPFFVIPDKCKCVDFQQVKLQELPENVPASEMPRHLVMFIERYLVDKVVPGNRVSAIGILSVRKTNVDVQKSAKVKTNVGTRTPFLRVLGIDVSDENSSNGPMRMSHQNYTPIELEEFKRIASGKDVYNQIATSIAPSIYGMKDLKKAIACLLFGGTRKKLPDGLYRRGDINLLILGDPGTAKSQLLKFVEKVSPISVFTTGRGASAAGLTASILRDPQSGQFVVEGGAMVLANGGVVCIDEFDKMKENDRVAMHEAMEQQTISIAKAGITSTLNTQCSVLAAANSVYGKWDDLKGDSNIDFMPTILSRFDMIFVRKDEFDHERDVNLARHVIKVHMNQTETEQIKGDLSIDIMKKYIAFCRANIRPRLTSQACERLKSQYVMMRQGAFQFEQELSKRLSVTISVRQLEALIRIAESLARMRMSTVATEADVNEALRLFVGSTYSAVVSGKLSDIEGLVTHEELRMLNDIEDHIKSRMVVGSQVMESHIIRDMTSRGFKERLICKVIHTMIRRGELQHRIQRKMLFRVM